MDFDFRNVLTCVCSHVGFEVGALGIGFPTARELAAVRCSAFSGPRPASSLLFDAPYLIVRVKRWRWGWSEHQPLHGSRVMLLVNAGRLSVHAVLSLILWQTLVCVLRLVGRVHVLVLEMVLIMVMRAHRVHLHQMAVCASLWCRVLHGVRTKPCVAWNRSLMVRKSCWVHRAHLVTLIYLSHKVPTTSSHHTRLTHRLGFNFISKRWRGCSHLVMSRCSWIGDGIQRPQLGVLQPVSRLAGAVRWTLTREAHLWREKLRHETADWTRACEAHGGVVALRGQVRRMVVAAVWRWATAAALRWLRQGIHALLRRWNVPVVVAYNIGADGVRQNELEVQ